MKLKYTESAISMKFPCSKVRVCTPWLEKSRCAAKLERELWNEAVESLSRLLPFANDAVRGMDKASVLRLTLRCLQMKSFSNEGTQQILKEVQNHCNGVRDGDDVGSDESQLLLDAFGGLVLIVGKTGTIIYVSDNVEKITGVPQSEMIGKRALEFIHLEDQQDFMKQFSCQLPSSEPMDVEGGDDAALSQLEGKSFSLRMKCHLQHVGLKGRHNGHLLTQWTGCMKHTKEGSMPAVQGMVVLVRPVHQSPLVEIRLDGKMFMSRHNLDMSFSYCDPRVKQLLGYEPSELAGHSFYLYHCPLDGVKMQHCFSSLMSQRSLVSKYFRFLSKAGEWIWMKSRATVISDSSGKAEYIVLLNYIYSEEEGSRCSQLEEEEEEGDVDVTSLQSFSFSSNLLGDGDDQSHLLERKPRGSPSSSSSGYESEMGENGAAIDLLSPDSPPSSPLSVDVTSISGASSVLTSPCATSPNAEKPTILSKSSLDSDYPFNKVPVGFNSLLDTVQSSTDKINKCHNSSDLSDLSSDKTVTSEHAFTASLCLSTSPPMSNTLTSPILSSNCSLSPPKISISLAEPSNTAAARSSPPMTMPLPDFDASGLSGDLDWLDEPGSLMSSSSSSTLFSSIGLDSSDGLLSSTDSLFSHSSLTSSLSSTISNPFAPSHTFAPTISYACVRSVANDHDYSAKPKDDPTNRRHRPSPPPMLNFPDNFSDALGDFDSSGESYGKSSSGFVVPSHANRPAKKRFRTPSTGSGGHATHSDSLLGALLGSSHRLSKVAAEARQSVAGLSSRISQATNFSPPKLNTGLSIGGFATDILGSSDLDISSLSANIPDKFSENLPEQRVRNQWLSYLAGESKTPPKRVPSVNRGRSSSATATCTNPSARPSVSNNRRNSVKASSASSSKKSKSITIKPVPRPKQLPSEGASLLEKFLLTEKPLNPNRGSDGVFPEKNVTKSMSQLQLESQAQDGSHRRIKQEEDDDDETNLLRGLLTGEIDNVKVERFEQNLILDRTFPGDDKALTLPMDTDSFPHDVKDLNLEMMFGDDNLPEDMDNFLQGFSGDLGDESDLDAIVREELRQEQLWMQEYGT